MFVDAANPADAADHRSVGFAEKASRPHTHPCGLSFWLVGIC